MQQPRFPFLHFAFPIYILSLIAKPFTFIYSILSSLALFVLEILFKTSIGSELRILKGDMEEQTEIVGRAFVDHYYNLFDNDRSSIGTLYQPSSMFSFEGQKLLGNEDISAKLNALPFGQCRHVISTIDSQPSSFAGGIIVFVSGSIQLLGEDHPLRFSQVSVSLFPPYMWFQCMLLYLLCVRTKSHIGS